MLRFTPLIAAALLCSCSLREEGPTVIDGSSPEAFAETMKEARSDLSPKDRVKFEAAVTEFRAQMFAKAETRAEYQRLVREGLDGLTAPRIVAKFDQNAAKAGDDAADAIFDAKRAIKAVTG